MAEAENATLLLRRGAEAIELSAKDGLLMFRLGGAEPEEWSPGDRQQLEALVARLEPPLRLRRSAVTLPRSSFNIDYASVDIVPDPDLMLTITAARFQGLAARLAALDGNCDAAVVHARVLAREALSLAVEPWIFFRILAVETQRMLLDVSLDVAPKFHAPG